MAYSITVSTGLGFDDAVLATRQALADEGFGVLTEIDLAATLKAKIGADLEPYLILGACRPPLAHAAVQADPSVGTLLPCSVVVRVADGRTIVEAMDPALLTRVTGQEALAEVAADAKGRLNRALATVASAS